MSGRPIRVLYVNHEGPNGSGSRALALLIANLPPDTVEAHVVSVSAAARDVGRVGGTVYTIPSVVNVRSIEGAALRGVRSLTLIRELWRARSGRRLRTVITDVRPDLVHLNARGMHQAAWLASRMGIPVVAHARSIADHGNPVVEFLHRRFAKHVHTVIAIDHAVQRSLTGHHDCRVIHNPLRCDPTASTGTRTSTTTPTTTTRVGYISPLLVHRGVLDVLEAARLLRDRTDIHFHIHGTNAGPMAFHRSLLGQLCGRIGLTSDLDSRLRTWAHDEGLDETVRFSAGTPTPTDLYGGLDLIVFPGHTNALPSCVPEAGLYGLPSVVTTQDGPDDIVRHHHTGLIARRSDPASLAAEIVRLVDDHGLRDRLGAAARSTYRTQFDPKRIGAQVLDVYERVLGETTR